MDHLEHLTYQFEQSRNNDQIKIFDLCLKRVFDLIVTGFGLLLGWPLFLVIAIGIRIDSPGPIIYKTLRLGKDRKLFWMYKFRTMVENAEKLLFKDPALKQRFRDKFKLEDDYRVTRFGRFLRRTGLDELPQLLNIIRGEMSLVGPRPIMLAERQKTTDLRLSVYPGLTGLWQVKGKSSLSYLQRCQLDEYYAQKRNLFMDIKICLQTLPAIVKGRGFF